MAKKAENAAITKVSDVLHVSTDRWEQTLEGPDGVLEFVAERRGSHPTVEIRRRPKKGTNARSRPGHILTGLEGRHLHTFLGEVYGASES